MRRLFAAANRDLLIAAFIPIVGLLPILGEGLANAADAPFHAHRIYALARLIETGNLYPRWVPYFHLGYGYPVFNFYPSGATHIGAWFHLMGFDVATSYNLTVCLAWSLGSIGIFLLSRRLLPVPAAWLACVLWVYAPSRFYEFWWQGSLAQIVSTSFIPFVFYGILRCRVSPHVRNSLWIAIPLAFIVLTHTPTTYIVGITIVPFCLFLSIWPPGQGGIFQRFRSIGLGLLLGAGLSTVFLLPALTELQYVKIGSELPDTVEFLRQNYLAPGQIFSLPQIIDSGDATLLMPPTLGLAGGILSGLGIAGLLSKRRVIMLLLLLAGLAFTVFLTREPSLDLWLAIPGFRNLRFPERIFRMASIFIAILGGASVTLLPNRWQWPAALLAISLVIAQVLPMMHPRDDERIWDNLSALNEIEMEYSERNWGTTSYNEYLPVWGRSIPFDMPPAPDRYIGSPLQIHVFESEFERRADRVSYKYMDRSRIWIDVKSDKINVRLRQFYFPGWNVTDHGEAIAVDADEEFGLIQLRLTEGAHLLELRYSGTPIQHIAMIISLVSLVACIAVAWRTKTGAPIDIDDSPTNTKWTVLVIGGIVAFALFNRSWLQSNIFRVKGDLDSPAHMQSRYEALFDDAVGLIGYTLDVDAIAAGNPLGLRLYWRLAAEETADYRPVVQLVNLGVSESWAVSQPGQFEGGKISDQGADKFMSDGHKLVLFDDVPPYVGLVSVQLRRAGEGGAMARLPDGSQRILLPEIIRIKAPQQPFAGRSSSYQFGGTLTLHCIETKVEADHLKASLLWEVRQRPSQDYVMFVHGTDDNGVIVSQSDREPLAGFYPTSHWRPGQHLRTSTELIISDTVREVALGLYDPDSGSRLPVTVGGANSDKIVVPLENSSC